MVFQRPRHIKGLDIFQSSADSNIYCFCIKPGYVRDNVLNWRMWSLLVQCCHATHNFCRGDSISCHNSRDRKITQRPTSGSISCLPLTLPVLAVHHTHTHTHKTSLSNSIGIRVVKICNFRWKNHAGPTKQHTHVHEHVSLKLVSTSPSTWPVQGAAIVSCFSWMTMRWLHEQYNHFRIPDLSASAGWTSNNPTRHLKNFKATDSDCDWMDDRIARVHKGPEGTTILDCNMVWKHG